MDSKDSNISVAILIGSLWGFFEASLGGLLHHMHSPITGQILAPIGFALLYLGMRNGLKPHQLIYVAVIAASFKFFDIILFSMPLLSNRIINPASAILSQGLAFFLVAGIFKNRCPKPNQIFKLALVTFIAFIPIFNLNSYILFGPNSTIYFENPIRALFINTPIAIALTTIFFLIVDSTVRFPNFLSLKRINLATVSTASLILALSAIVIRGLIV
ncbi:MAG: hypothetical protein ABIE74_10790 [Pseudomonadota bacterium]